MKPSDLFGLQAVTAVVLHPEGTSTAYTVGWPDESSNRNASQLWLHDSADDSHRPLTESASDTRPRFSPDGTRIAFLRADAGSKPQPSIIEVSTGDVTMIAGFEQDGATGVEWIDDARIAVSFPLRPADQDGVDQQDGDPDELAARFRVLRSVDYRFNGRGWTHDRPGQISVVELATGTVTRLTDGERDHAGLAVSSDGASILTTASVADDGDLTGENAVLRIAVDGSGERVLTQPGSRWATVGWIDGATGPTPIAIGSTRAGNVTLQHPHVLDPSGRAAPARIGDHDVSAASLVGDGGRMIDVDGDLMVPGVRRGRVSVDRYSVADGSCTTVAEVGGVISSFDAIGSGDSAGSRIVAAVSTPTRPAELWEFVDGIGRVIRSLNDDVLATLDLVEPEVVQVPSTGGAVVEAFVVRPPASAPDLSTDGSGPGLVYVHGGPMFAYGLGFFDEFQLAAAAGYTVIGGNPRGSDGYGEEWASTLAGRLGTIDAEDVTAIADHLASLPEVDPDRIGIGGGSYGGFMTSWMIGHTDRFKAALVERAVTNWESFAGTSDIGSWFGPMLLGASVESGVEALRHMSPLTYASAVTTPTLIMHAEEDWRCPIEQSEQLFAAYRRNGVDVTFVRIPGENHELTRNGTPHHRVDRFELVHEFFAEHV